MKQKKIVAIIQARVGSSRFPGKVLKKIGNKTLLEILVNRIKKVKNLDDIIIATSTNPKDKKIEELAEKLSVKCYRGSEENVLERYVEASKLISADIIVRVTADNPLTDPQEIDNLILSHINQKNDYTYSKGTLLGISGEVVNAKVLRIIDKLAKKSCEREHVTLYLRNHPEEFKVRFLKPRYLSNFSFSVDTERNLSLIKKIYCNLGNLEKISIKEVFNFLKKENREKIKVSVIIRSFNSEKFIRKALRSTLNQTLSKYLYEIIIIDDHSSDRTWQILKAAQKKHPKQIKVFLNPFKGPIRALNFGINQARGKFIILLDADDIFNLNILQEMHQTLKANKNIGFVYCDYYEKNLGSDKQKTISLKNNIFNSIAGGIMFRKKILHEIGLYNEKLIFPGYDLLIKIIKKYKGKYIPKPLFTYIRHKGSITANKNKVKRGKKQLFQKYKHIINNLRNY